MDATELLSELDAIRSQTRDDLRCGSWQWLFVWAMAALGSVLTMAVPALHDIASIYWLGAVPIALAATAFVERSHRREARVLRRGWPYWLTGAGITVLNFGGSVILPAEWMVIWLWVVLAAGFGVLLMLDRQPSLAVAFGLLSVAFLAAGAASSDRFLTSVVVGAILSLGLVGAAGVVRAQSAES